MSYAAVDITGPDGGLEARIEWAIDGISDWSPVWSAVVRAWPESRRAMFASDGWGRWAGYTPAERAMYVPLKLAQTKRAELLRWDGGERPLRLMRSLTEPDGNPDSEVQYQDEYLTLGTRVRYAARQIRGGTAPKKYGGHPFPGRDFLSIGPELHRVINDAVGDLAGAISKGVAGASGEIDISKLGGNQ